MSEYQYYEFQAVDRPLTAEEMRELRAVSTRAEITPLRFTNEYQWGDFKGNPAAWMERYFDGFLYLANWGTRELMLRLPKQALELALVRRYLSGEAAGARVKGEHLILSFVSGAEDSEGEWVEGEGVLSSILPLRAELAAGDHRALYLGWLASLQAEELEEEATEPPVPPGLGALSPALRAFADFLRLDEDLIAAAAERSAAPLAAPARPEVARWIAALPAPEKDALLLRVLAGQGAGVQAELLRRLRESQPRPPGAEARQPRTVAELQGAARRCAEQRRRREAEEAERERARRAEREAREREGRLRQLAGGEAQAWRRAEQLIEQKQAAAYDEAVRLLGDLKALAEWEGRAAEAVDRIHRLREAHSRKYSFVERLRNAGL